MKRLIEQDLIKWKSDQNRKPLILKGTRQVGKTYLLKEFGKKHFRKCHYINFERDLNVFEIFEKDLKPKRILKDLSFYLDTSIDLKEDLIIFDEIQECSNALTSLKYFQEDLDNINLCAAGSLLGIYLDDTSFPVGKVDMLNLYPISFNEFLQIIDEKRCIDALKEFGKSKNISEIAHQRLIELLKHYFIVGGMPEAVLAYLKNRDDLFTAFEIIRKKQELITVAYFADMSKHSSNVNAMHLNRLFKSVPAQLQESIDGSSKKFRFKDVVPGISHYDRLVSAIDWLENMGLILKNHIVNYGKSPLKGHYKENIFKMFIFDVGILGSLCNLSPKQILNYDYGSYKGFFAENFVLQELISQNVKSYFSWQEKKSEVEFLVEIDDLVLPIEVKSGFNTRSKSLKVFSDKYDPINSVILSLKPYCVKESKSGLNQSKQIYYYPLYMIKNVLDLCKP